VIDKPVEADTGTDSLPPREALFYVTVLITSHLANGETSTGTAFRFDYREDESSDMMTPFLVTNKHVISGAIEGEFAFTLADEDGNPRIGSVHTIVTGELSEPFEAMWYGHSDPKVDVAVLPMGPLLNILQDKGVTIFSASLTNRNVVPVQELYLRTLEDVLFLGYPLGLVDTVNNVPIARQGVTATPWWMNYNGEPKFLIDASVFPGSSGSPVMVFDEGSYATRNGIAMGSRMILLGIIAEYLEVRETNLVEVVPVPTSVEMRVGTSQNLSIGVVFKASTILETVESAMQVFRAKGWLQDRSQLP
jgi:hypothetical protein